MREPLAYTRLYLPRPLELDAVIELLGRLSARDVGRPVVFEVRADDAGLQHLLGCAPTSVHQLKRLLRAALPEVAFGSAERSSVSSAGRMVTPVRRLPVGKPNPEAVTQSILTALSARRDGELIVLQLVLGEAQRPSLIADDESDPLQPLSSQLLSGPRPASAPLRRRLQEQASEPHFAVTLRVGVSGPDQARRTSLIRSLVGSLQPLETIGVSLRLVREPARFLAQAAARPGLHLSAADLAVPLAWPYGDRNYPGIGPAHPVRLPVPDEVSRTDSVFAVGTAPGPTRPVGISPKDRLSHLAVLAPTGAGKSEAVLAPLALADIEAGRPVVVVDPKGQLVDYLLDCLPKEASSRVVVIDPSDLDGTASFNPLDTAGRDPYVVVDSIMAVLRALFADGWGPRTEDLLHTGLLTLALDGERRGHPHTLLDLPTLLTDASFRRSVVPGAASDPHIANAWARFDAWSPGQRENAISAPLNKLRRFMMRRSVRKVLGRADSSFRLRDIFRSDAVVLVALNDALAGPLTSQLIGGLVCAEVFMAVQERAAERDPQSRPGFVYVDEIARFLRLPLSLSAALEVSRSYGVGWALFGQGRYQLDAGLAEGIDINARSKLAFRSSPSEAKAFARQTLALTVGDIVALPKYECYASLLSGGSPSDWFSARTLPPPKRRGHGASIRSASRRRHGQADPPDATSPQQLPPEPGLPPSSPPNVKRRRT
jgi:hypothetical protein